MPRFRLSHNAEINVLLPLTDQYQGFDLKQDLCQIVRNISVTKYALIVFHDTCKNELSCHFAIQNCSNPCGFYLKFVKLQSQSYLNLLPLMWHGPLAGYVKLRVTHAPGMAGTFSSPLRVSDPGMHHDTFVTYVPWCIAVSFEVGGGKNVPGIPGACATRNFSYLARGPLSLVPASLEIQVMVMLKLQLKE